MLKVENIKKEFVSGDQTVKAVDGVNLNIPTGTFSVIIGKSGSGKSTLLSLLGALDTPTSGSIEVDKQDVTKLSDRKLSLYRCNKIGFVFQGYNLIPNLTALENVMLPMEFADKSLTESKIRAEKLLVEVGITDQKQNRKPARLSGGEQQRVAIARALANQPKLILADEPTGNLDSHTGKLIVDLLRKLAKDEKTTIIAVTHDESIAKLADVTFTLKDGKLTK
ncbi:MAG: ABC transporter ATP-binding protein [bacterium]